MLNFLILKEIEDRMAAIEVVPSTIGLDPPEESDIVIGTIVDDDLKRLCLAYNWFNSMAKRTEIELRATQNDPGRNPGKIAKYQHLIACRDVAFILFEKEVVLRYTLPNRSPLLRSDWSIVIDLEEERRAERRRRQTVYGCGN